MKLRSILSIGFAALLATALLGLGGCDPADFGKDKVSIKDQKGEVLGFVFFSVTQDFDCDGPCYHPDLGDVPLPDVTATWTDSAGGKTTAKSNAKGHYEVSGLAEGIYDWTLVAEGYETQTGLSDMEFSPEVNNVQTSTDTMDETHLFATVTGISAAAVLKDQDFCGSLSCDSVENGVDKVSATYSVATSTTIIVTFSAPVLTDYSSACLDGNTSGGCFNSSDATAVPATATATTNTTYTIPEVGPASCSSTFNCGINDVANVTSATGNINTLSNNVIIVRARRITPLNGVEEFLEAELDILVNP